MPLYTTDYLEYYLTLVGWLVHNGIWNILMASGVFALPFVAIMLSLFGRDRVSPRHACARIGSNTRQWGEWMT